MDKLTPQLNDQQIRENIDALLKGGKSKDDVQKYVDNYSKGTDGNYVLKTTDTRSNYEKAMGIGETKQQKEDNLKKITDTVTSIFPGKQVGEAIGTLGGLGITAAKEKLGLAPKGSTEKYDTSAPSPLQVAGDVAQGALMVAAPNIGNGATVAGRIGANTALGAGIGATGAIKEGKGIGDIAKETAIGGAIGGGASVVGEGIKALAENLPKWLTKMALPKLENKNIPYALDNTKIGSLPSLQKQSTASMSNYEDQIQSILSHPEFKAVAEDSYTIVDKAVKNFPNSEYTTQDLIDNAKNIAPKVSKLITKFEAGQADIQEINAIRKELDAATKSVYTSLNRPPEAKLLGATLANSMRDFVQTNAPETRNIFSKYSQEIGLNKALSAAIKKGEQKIRLGDIGAGVAGFAKGGFQGALEAILAERLILNPAAQIGAAKVLQGASKVLPVASKVIRGVKAPIIKKITN